MRQVVIKPAIKEHFIYATKAKAWRANNRAELAERLQRAATLVRPGEIMVQELIPRSLRSFQIESVFCREDPLPGLMELALIPYLALKRGF